MCQQKRESGYEASNNCGSSVSGGIRDTVAVPRAIIEDSKLAEKLKATDDLHAMRDRIADRIERLAR